MSKIEKARRLLGEAVVEKPERTGQVTRGDGEIWVPTVWAEYTERLEKAIDEALELLEGVEEEKHHPMEIRSKLEGQAEIKAQDERAKRQMYGGE